MPSNGHWIAFLRMLLNSKTDRILGMTLKFCGAHIFCIALCYIAPAGCFNDGKPQFNLRAKIEDGIQKNKHQPVRHDFIHLHSLSLFLSPFCPHYHPLIRQTRTWHELCPQHASASCRARFIKSLLHLWLLTPHLIFSSLRPICVLLQRDVLQEEPDD